MCTLTPKLQPAKTKYTASFISSLDNRLFVAGNCGDVLVVNTAYTAQEMIKVEVTLKQIVR